MASRSFGGVAEAPSVQSGVLLVDDTHRNDFTKEEVSVMLTRVAGRGYAIEFMGEGSGSVVGATQRLAVLGDKLRKADSFAVILPLVSYPREEADLVERFVEKGGKLVLIADPTRNHDIQQPGKAIWNNLSGRLPL